MYSKEECVTHKFEDKRYLSEQSIANIGELQNQWRVFHNFVTRKKVTQKDDLVLRITCVQISFKFSCLMHNLFE